MSKSRVAQGAIFVACLAAGSVSAQQSAQMPPLPKPGPEHAVLKADVGVWDAVVETFEAPGAPAAKSKAVETNTMIGDLFLVTDFKGEFMGASFQGHGMSTWDATKKKYVAFWGDNMSTGFTRGESTYDATSRKMSGYMEGPDMTGKMMKMREVVEHVDADTRIFTMYNVDAAGKESMSMRITYKRRK